MNGTTHHTDGSLAGRSWKDLFQHWDVVPFLSIHLMCLLAFQTGIQLAVPIPTESRSERPRGTSDGCSKMERHPNAEKDLSRTFLRGNRRCDGSFRSYRSCCAFSYSRSGHCESLLAGTTLYHDPPQHGRSGLYHQKRRST